jgi:hypothetical protein
MSSPSGIDWLRVVSRSLPISVALANLEIEVMGTEILSEMYGMSQL